MNNKSVQQQVILEILHRYQRDNALQLPALNFANEEGVDIDLSGRIAVGEGTTFEGARILHINGASLEAPGLVLSNVDALEGRIVLTNAIIPEAQLDNLKGRINLAGAFAPKLHAPGVKLADSNMNAKLPDADFTGCHFRACKFGGSYTGSCWAGVTLEDIARFEGNFDRADVTGIDFSGVTGDEMLAIPKLKFSARAARLDDVNFGGHDIRHITLSADTSMQGADLRNCDARGQDFSGIDMRGADLRGLDARDSKWAGADLRGAKIDDSTRFEGAQGLDTVITDNEDLALFQRFTHWAGLARKFGD